MIDTADTPLAMALRAHGEHAPRRARALAARALGQARDDPEVESVVHRALSRAARTENDLETSRVHARKAIAIAASAGLAEREAEGRETLALTLAYLGRTSSALRELDRAAEVMHGLGRARVEGQRAQILARMGRHSDALRSYASALSVVRRHRDRLWEVNLLNNRAILRTYAGDLSAAFTDLECARSLAAGFDRSLAAMVESNVAFALGRSGDIPRALSSYDEALKELTAGGATAPVLHADRAELLLFAGMATDARRDASAAVDALREGRHAADVAEARLLLARAELASGDAHRARRTAGEAARAFARQQRSSWAALARYVALTAEVVTTQDRAGPPPVTLLDRARSAALDLELSGWRTEALHARTVAARVALALGRTLDARAELEAASQARRRGPAEHRAGAWHARALLRLTEGDRAGARRALRAGIEVVDHYRATLGATELRAHASSHATDLARTGLRLAIEDRRATEVLAWAERWRAGALAFQPARPPDDSVFARKLAALRRTAAELRAATLEGAPTARLAARQADLEEQVRSHARHASGRERQPGGRLDLRSLKAALGSDRALVAYVQHDDAMYAVTVTAGRAQLRLLANAADVAQHQAHLAFALRRLGNRRLRREARQAAHEQLRETAGRIDELLTAPLVQQTGERPWVIVPTGSLHTLPWSTLPSLAGRAITITPSVSHWLHAHEVTGSPGAVVLVAGPDLPYAAQEVARLSRSYADVVTLRGANATVDAVAAAVDGATLAHIASHGAFRADNPLFSCLVLADGPLNVFDLERLHRAPEIMILPVCDAASTDVRPGDELLGLSAALLSVGTRSLIAPVAPVPDDAVTDVMVELHRRLYQDETVDTAVAAVTAPRDGESPSLAAARASFVCLGAA